MHLMKVAAFVSLSLMMLAGVVAHADESPMSSAKETTYFKDGIKYVEKVEPDGTKITTSFHPGGEVPAKEVHYKRDLAKPYIERTFGISGKLMFEVVRTDDFQHSKTFAADKLFMEVLKQRNGDEVTSLYRPQDGSLLSKTYHYAKDNRKEYEYYATDGRKLHRVFDAQGEMFVTVFAKGGKMQYRQTWTSTNRGYRLTQVEVIDGPHRRLVFLAADGKTIEKVEYYRLSCGWLLIKTENGDKLTQPVDKSQLQEFGGDDVTAPRLSNP